MKRVALALALVLAPALVACRAAPPPPSAAAPAPLPASAADGGVSTSAAARSRAAGRTRFGAIVVSGGVERSAVVERLHGEAASFDACATAPDLAGRVTLHFQIEADGAVSNVTADRASDIDDPSVQSCVANVVKPLTFAAPSAGAPARVIAPIVFTSPDAPQR